MATPKKIKADTHIPALVKNNAPTQIIEIVVKVIKIFFVDPLISVNAPIIGALIKRRKLERAIVHSKYAADWTEVKSFPQNSGKNNGKNAAKTVVANAELPRSYEIHAFSSLDILLF